MSIFYNRLMAFKTHRSPILINNNTLHKITIINFIEKATHKYYKKEYSRKY